jgi:uncharacterized membrane protein YraQ (UPF0718 family)
MTGLGRVHAPAISAASFLGVLSPLCMYGTVPVIAAFGRKGVPAHLLAAFMVSSVLLNPNLFVLGFVLGAHLALARLGLALLCGILAGVLVLRFFKKKPLFNFDKFAPRDKGKKTFFPDLFKAFRITAPYLLLGTTLTALFTRYVPPDAVAGVFGARRGLGVLFAASLSIPLYVCGGGVMPLLRAWLFVGMGYGDALAFMLAGPATKIMNLAAVKMILGAKNFILYLAYVLGFAMLVGLAVEFWR